MYLPTAARRGNGNGLLRRVLNSTRTASTTSSPKQLVPKEVKLLRKERVRSSSTPAMSRRSHMRRKYLNAQAGFVFCHVVFLKKRL
mmetsp:Transcript_38580/g.152237  ORF Transcript_38580/g.152237 Transcript_38580/m.152237 type:complete len:86 (-) Transcript_38580:4668-4925(-)